VAEVFGHHRLAFTQDQSLTAEVFADGLSLRDGRTLEEWRLASAHPD
jgi:hypothetical protein